jgi:uncharacterized protein YegP (UPF0339 family)
MKISSFFNFNSIDKKIKDLGFKLVYRSDLVLQFERYNAQFNYVHGIDLVRKTTKTPIIQSYQKNNDKMVGLNINETKLFLKLIKKLKWY